MQGIICVALMNPKHVYLINLTKARFFQVICSEAAADFEGCRLKGETNKHK